MKQTRQVYYFDYCDEAYNFIMESNILKNNDKKILKDFINKFKVKELAKKYNCCEMTICRKRKELFDKTKILMDYTSKNGNIEKYYQEQQRKLKIYGEEEFKVIDNDSELYKVYLLTFPNEKVYIGITSQSEKNRWKNGNGYINNTIMYNDILKYGWINIKKNILYKDLLYEEAREKEKELIINYKSHLKRFGYNNNF